MTLINFIDGMRPLFVVFNHKAFLELANILHLQADSASCNKQVYCICIDHIVLWVVV